jgi:hypothetical protein
MKNKLLWIILSVCKLGLYLCIVLLGWSAVNYHAAAQVSTPTKKSALIGSVAPVTSATYVNGDLATKFGLPAHTLFRGIIGVPASNSGTITFKSTISGASDVTSEAGASMYVSALDLTTISAKGNGTDVITLVGEEVRVTQNNYGDNTAY